MDHHDDDHLKFPSGRTVSGCRKDAKRLVREGGGLKLAEAQDEIAKRNGATKPWHHAIAEMRSARKLIASSLMTRSDVRSVLIKHPELELTHFGLGPSSQNLKGAAGHYGRAVELGQTELLDALDECSKACLFLRHVKKRKSMNRKWTSYGLKHQAERFVRSRTDRPENTYMANGALICAALHLGFDVQRERLFSPNAYFNMSSRSPVFEWRRLVATRSTRLRDPDKRSRLAALCDQLGTEATLGRF